jgi:hypothetical protein
MNFYEKSMHFKPIIIDAKINRAGLTLSKTLNSGIETDSVFLNFNDSIDYARLNIRNEVNSPVQIFDIVNYMEKNIYCFRLYNYWENGFNLLIYLDQEKFMGFANECQGIDGVSLIVSYCGFIPDYYNHSFYPQTGLKCP